MNLQTSHVAFAFMITPELMVRGIFFALVMGVVGGLLPAIRAVINSAFAAIIVAQEKSQSLAQGDWLFFLPLLPVTGRLQE